MNLPFYDYSQIAPVVPVVRDSSELFHAYTLHVHLKICPHTGVKTSMKEVNRKMFVLRNPMWVVARVRKECSKYRRTHLQTTGNPRRVVTRVSQDCSPTHF